MRTEPESLAIAAPAPTVSVLITAYNAARFVEEAVRSVLAQTFTDFELIIVDDGSTDDTWRKIEALARTDPRVRPHHQANEGAAGALNRCISMAGGRYLAILDSDDAMLPERLAMQVAYLEANPDISTVGTQWVTMTEGGLPSTLDRHPTAPEDVATSMYSHFALHHPTLMVRRPVMTNAGGYPQAESSVSFDYELFMRLLEGGKHAANLPFVLTRWRLTSSGITHSKARQQTEHVETTRRIAFMRLLESEPARADEIAVSLVRNAPAGDWFDDKVARILPGHPPSAHLQRWQALAAHGAVPALEAAAVAWLRGQPHAAAQLGDALRAAGFTWLTGLFDAHAGGAAPIARPGIVRPRREDDNGARPLLSLLVPYTSCDVDLDERLTLARASTQTLDAEVIVFPLDATAENFATLPDTRVLSFAGTAGGAWQAALAASRGTLLTFLEPGHQPATEFWRDGVRRLHADPRVDALYSPPRRCWEDARAATGEPFFDPSPEPLWTRATLLGKDCISLSGLLMRRAVFDELPLVLGECGESASALLARLACIRARLAVCDARGIQFLPRLSLRNRVMETLTHRLGSWYLDSGLGLVPGPSAWDGLDSRDALKRIEVLDAAFERRQLALHPGNAQMLAEFVTRFAGPFFRSKVLDMLLLQFPAITIGAVSKSAQAYRPLYQLRRATLRMGRRLQRGAVEHDA